jgi:hypothetical protein
MKARLWILIAFLALPTFLYGQVLPVKVSENRRYLVYQDNVPFFYHADTAWMLVYKNTREEAELYLENRRAKGFTVIQMTLLNFHDLASKNRYGDGPFTQTNNFTTPNDKYFDHVDWVIQKAKEKNLVVIVNPVWILRWRNIVNSNGTSKCRSYGRYLGNRYKGYDNVMWFIGGDAKPGDAREELNEMALGIKENAPNQLMTYHSNGESSLEAFPTATWLDLNWVYTYDKPLYKEVYENYAYSRVMPLVLGEAEYENEYNHLITTIRRQAYWTVLAGGCGEAVGINPVWKFASGWKDFLNSPGAQQMSYLKRVYTSIDWFKLVPDPNGTLITQGRGTYGAVDYITAARTSDGNAIMAYIPFTGTNSRTFVVDMTKLSESAEGQWFNPVKGTYTLIQGSPFANTGIRSFTTPGNNGENANDWVLVLKTKNGGTDFPTPTPSPTPIDGCNITSGGNTWINNSFVNQTGTFTATFDATPSTSPSNMHVGLSSGAQTAYTGFAAIIRFNTSGNIDARNGGAYSAASAIPYAANTKYSFRVVVNVPAHTYSVYVTPAGGSEVAVGENFAFRTEQATVSQLNNYGAYVEGSSGSLQVCNFSIGGGGGVTTVINEDCSSIANFTKVSGGTWGVNSSGQCTLTAAATCTSPLCNILTHNTSVSGDFTLTAEGAAASSTNAWDDFAIVFGYVDASNYYYASFNEGDDAGTNGIFRVQAGTKTQVVDFGSNVTAPGTTLHAIKVVKTGTTVKVYKGSALIGTLSSASIGSGKVGFGAYNNNATFDNLKVTNP